ncbi:bifunctional proline dehydrogenase/L-glutamate gamma-semialdehyde dehydrogenase PutA [Vibrio hippocampi]|uniref:Bifunctional protein PutA n=1 Tax=Vibrio hippocampi TaxID=654686 RepID=A0ABM8ZNY8_9VIBR|nr:bifunctional proline dehydrogenase/L-glutamate gamma-semialdehyde dehydrogenase PutA [Vibrio hippocampi]CAH0530384.1 Bifunctional protein PutA [Vibrio hippocampi]
MWQGLQQAMTDGFYQQPLNTIKSNIFTMYQVDEAQLLAQLIPLATATNDEQQSILSRSQSLIQTIRSDKKAMQAMDALLLEYSLDTEEGILLMCLAEAMLRIPDVSTAHAFIADKLCHANWQQHMGQSSSVLVNAATWGLMLTGGVLQPQQKSNLASEHSWKALVSKLGKPVVYQAVQQAMKLMGQQFVLGQTIAQAKQKARSNITDKQSYSFDMLGEAALTEQDAQRYFKAYASAIEEIAALQNDPALSAPSISIKLSALHPRYEATHRDQVLTELYQRLLSLVEQARQHDVAVTIDAEEADRLEISLDLFEKVFLNTVCKGWGKFGVVVQAYSKRAMPVLAWLTALAKQQQTVIPVRLVKGAYWDSEIKWAQQGGYRGYPVFTRKESTDVSYLVCARFLFSDVVQGALYPQFATHNAHTISALSVMATHNEFEFQRLHGMGEALYHHLGVQSKQRVRIYAPVGRHKELLPYLVRRLLENGANSSFVHQVMDKQCAIESLVRHPVDQLNAIDPWHNPITPLPKDIYLNRSNSTGINLNVASEVVGFIEEVNTYKPGEWYGFSLINGQAKMDDEYRVENAVFAPYQTELKIGIQYPSSLDHVSEAIKVASDNFVAWSQLQPAERAQYLTQFADKLEQKMPLFAALCHHEAGKTVQDSIDEVREAIDFCRYYALQSEKLGKQAGPDWQMQTMEVTYQGSGVWACISPWNFPLAIFIGQIAGALVAGNCVVAKPAQQTSLIATKAIQLLLSCGIPSGVIQLVLGGVDIGHALTTHPSIAGVAFTGSTQTAKIIAQTLAQRSVSPVPFIAETGGQNVMIADSTAQPEQLVKDVIRSAFASAGQRCSALRVLLIQQDIADEVIEQIKGAMAQLNLGLPYLASTDVGPVIDQTAKTKLEQHIEKMRIDATLIYQCPLLDWHQQGHFIAPTLLEINDLNQLTEEQFGPILHLLRFKAADLESVIERVNQLGFGLTLGIHSRNETTYRWIERKARVGNCYINRDQVGAVVGVQPFGGMGLSGTGPKAGGPNYLYRFTRPSVSMR